MGFFLIFLSGLVIAIFMAIAPFAMAAFGYYLLRRKGTDQRRAVLFGIVPVLAVLAWPLTGLLDLHEQCGRTAIVRSSAEKLGPVSTLFVEGPGMWWLDGRIDIERRDYGRADLFVRREIKKVNDRRHPISLTQAELRSRYKVSVNRPESGSFFQRYLTSAAIVIEERTTGTIVASFTEPAWGGGLAGSYIGVFTALNPFLTDNNHLSCGYAGEELGIFRGHSKERSKLYREADQRLIEQVFVLSATSDAKN